MSKILENLREVIISSESISLNDQNDLLVFLPILPEQTLENLLRLFQKDHKLLKKFNEDFKDRLNILINGRDKWTKLIEKEEGLLEEEEELMIDD